MAREAGPVAGYDPAQLVTFVWMGQGLLGVVLLWSETELADRIRTGDVVADLLRPVDPVTSHLATDLGRAGYAVLARMLPPVLVGPVFFEVYLPTRWTTGLLFPLSVLLAVVTCFGCRYLVNSTAYWLHDVRGPMILFTLSAGVLSGLYFPLRFLPEGLYQAMWIVTPFPSLFQTPLDVLVEVDPSLTSFALVGVQVVWAALILAACRLVQRRAERRLVVQGG
ncbi:ABC transporter permease [Micromonospora pallida]|uniref:ABC transporter permease n=1 Tax=Micromonospora pallida TaxID=145854 RepID=UPI001FE08040|nr:ABC-2 family transporter protein [Micromonospora pallida]